VDLLARVIERGGGAVAGRPPLEMGIGVVDDDHVDVVQRVALRAPRQRSGGNHFNHVILGRQCVPEEVAASACLLDGDWVGVGVGLDGVEGLGEVHAVPLS